MTGIMEINRLRNNCTLVAVQEITHEDDAKIINAFLARGYKKGRGTVAPVYLGVLEDLGYAYEEVDTVNPGRKPKWGTKNHRTWWGEEREVRTYYHARKYLTVSQFCRKHEFGTFLVRVDGHALVVRNGRMIDPNHVRSSGMKRRVKGAWRITNA